MKLLVKSGAFLSIFSFLFMVDAQDWENFRGPKYDGKYVESGLNLDFGQSKPQRVWKVKVKTGFSSIVTSKGKVYTMGHSGGRDYVYCLDDKTGKEIWVQKYKGELQPNLYEGGPNSTPTVHDGLLYTLGKHGQFYCWDANDGKEKWSVDISKKYGYKAPDWGFSSSPYISGEHVILNAGSGGLALDRKTGVLAWKSSAGKASYASPVPYQFGSKNSILLFAANKLKCIDPYSGKQHWQLDWKTSYDINSADPVLYGKDIFISSGYGKGASLVAVEAGNAKFSWKNGVMRNHFSCSVVVGDYVYGVDGNTNDRNASLKCISLKVGKEVWSEGLGFASVTMANDKLLILREKGQLLSVDASPKEYKENGRVQILGGKCWTSPIVSNGHLYARNAKGDFVKLKIK